MSRSKCQSRVCPDTTGYKHTMASTISGCIFMAKDRVTFVKSFGHFFHACLDKWVVLQFSSQFISSTDCLPLSNLLYPGASISTGPIKVQQMAHTLVDFYSLWPRQVVSTGPLPFLKACPVTSSACRDGTQSSLTGGQTKPAWVLLMERR